MGLGEQGRGSPLCPRPVLHKGKRPREAVAGHHGDTEAGKDPQGNLLNTRNVNVKAGPMLRLPPAPCPAAQELPQDHSLPQELLQDQERAQDAGYSWLWGNAAARGGCHSTEMCTGILTQGV